MTDEFHGHGGSYVMKDGKRTRVEEPTKDHPEGNRARDKDGRPIVDAPAEDRPAPQPANVKQIRGAKPPLDE